MSDQEKTSPNPADLRVDYRMAALSRAEVDSDPLTQFQKWFEEAVQAELPEPNAMILATATTEATPSTRIVLLKGIESGAFTFFTNYDSQKSSELAANAQAALTFPWIELQRQVNIQGTVERTSREASEAYFQCRPYGSQIGAHASAQSSVIPNREWLEKRNAALEEQYPEGTVPLPENWGGFRVVPVSIEFWQGRSSRLHDRIRYKKNADGTWNTERLSP